jgi:hypothetical protein
MKLNIYILVIICLSVVACDQNDSVTFQSDGDLAGTWLHTERGWSPGSGYFVDPVSPEPAQTITFIPPRQFKSNIEGLSQLSYYTVATDTSNVSKLFLYSEDPESNGTGASPIKYFVMELSGVDLKLRMQCIEGCHLGFQKIEYAREKK